MTQAEFIELVAKMRIAQKNYFKTRSKDVLIQSKNLEQQLDKAIGQISSRTEQERLFDRDCVQLGEIFLNINRQKYVIASAIGPRMLGPFCEMQSFEVVNVDNTSRYRIIFTVEEVSV
jgi:hypothetical protein